MFISKVYKKDSKTDKKYYYFRLMRSYRIGNKTRQQYILDLGRLENLPPEKHKLLADRIEQIIEGQTNFYCNDILIEQLAKKYANQIIDEKKIFVNKQVIKQKLDYQEQVSDFQIVDINSLESENAREIGSEWVAKQAIEQIGLDKIIKEQSKSEKQAKIAQIALISRMVHPASELETQRWLQENSAVNQLFELKEDEVSRHDLTAAADFLYKNKELIERVLYQNITTLFSLQSKIVIYDLTNMYFEGQKNGSKYCKFGRSKEKRNDCRLICMGLVVNEFGFVFYSKFYAGNQSEPNTLAEVVSELQNKTNIDKQSPVIVMDAGITTEKNLLDLRKTGHNYICVSRSKIKKYEIIETEPITVQDNKGNEIKMQKIKPKGKEDYFVLVDSEQKKNKEQSMSENLNEKYELELDSLIKGLQKKGARKKIADLYQRIGRLKQRHHFVSHLYELEFVENKKLGIIETIKWTKKQNTNEFDGRYFLRYSNPTLSTQQIWQCYNTIREVESTFRCLKTDLQIRPIYHKFDEHCLSHVFVGILAYQAVNSIRFQLKNKDINLSWTTLVKKLNTYKSVTTEVDTNDGKKIILKYCLRPSPQVRQIFERLDFKIVPFKKQKYVVTELQI